MSDVTLDDMWAIVDQEFTFASTMSRKGRKSITCNPIRNIVRIYVNGLFTGYEYKSAVEAIQEYNSIDM